MSRTRNVQVSRLASVDVGAQVNATHNTSFPFSSPMLEDHNSLKSIRTGNTALSQNPFESPNSSTTTLTDYESGATSEQDAWHLERYSESSRPNLTKTLAVPKSKSIVKPSARSPGLQIITDFSKPSYHVNNLVIDHVQARQAQTRANHARSIISQKGVKFESTQSGTNKRSSALLNVRGIMQGKKPKRKAILQPAGDSKIQRTQSEKSIVIGLCIPQDEAHALQQQGGLDSAISLNTPLTPAIILTPPDERLEPSSQNDLSPPSESSKPRPASSVYSMITCSKEHNDEDDEVPPLPHLPLFAKVNNLQVAESKYSSNPNTPTHGTRGLAHFSPRSAEQVPESCDTPRSQGWWNLLLSPMLSRTGSSASRRGHDADYSPPPVPEIPNDLEKNMVMTTPNTNTSPETPRRLGLACTPHDTWSNWNEMERQILDIKKGTAINDDANASMSTTELPSKVFPVKYSYPEVSEGLAAEYYHACAIEQLTGANYFDCINHSCQDHLPKLISSSIKSHEQPKSLEKDAEPYSHSEKVIMLGSPFESNKSTNLVFAKNTDQAVYDDDSSITDFESDGEEDHHGRNLNRSSPAKGEDVSTPIGSEGEPDELSPNIREANTAAFVKARARGITETAKPTQEASSQPHSQMPNLAAVVSQTRSSALQLPVAAQKAKSVESLLAMSIKSSDKPVPALPLQSERSTPATPNVESQRQLQTKPQMLSQQFFMNPKGGFSGLPATPTAVRAFKSHPVRKESLAKTHRATSFDVESRETLHVNEKQSKQPREHCLTLRNIFQRKKDKPKTEKKKKRRKCVICICILLLIIVIVCIVLATTLTRRGDGTPVASRWLNLTGYPPMPIGISTIAQPDLAQIQTGCVQPSTLWSCSLPKDNQERTASNGSNVPDFRFEIKYRNGTTPANMNIPLTKRANDPFTNDLFTSNPAPPNDADQIFLGNTTDNITAPFNGEPTPFYITFMSTFPVVPSAFNTSTSRLKSRQSNLGINIPAPGSLPDGSALPASLLPTSPFPTSQPVRLYNRGHDDEHYGFYIYYDKSVFLSGIAISGGNTSVSNSAGSNNPDDDGGAAKDAAKTRCTWQQTRFLVKIFTNTKFGGSIFPGRGNITLDTSQQSEYNSATDFKQPGSFPYPTSIITDRHGGNINNKIAYCYGMDRGKIEEDEKVLVFEDRSAGGVLINGAPSFVNDDGSNNKDQVTNSFDSGAGGIDGGTGGCSCTWQNWR